jgi:hypothetical protein
MKNVREKIVFLSMKKDALNVMKKYRKFFLKDIL